MAWLFNRTSSGKQTQRSQLTNLSDPAVARMFGLNLPHITVNEQSAMSLSAVYRAVGLISGSIATLPLRTVETGDDGRKERARSWLDEPGLDRFTAFEWKELVLVHLLIHGNAYLMRFHNGAGAMKGLIPVHPGMVSVEWDDTRPGGRVYTVDSLKLDSREIVHIMGPSLDGLTGMSVVSQARQSLATGLEGDRAANAQFANGATISGMVTDESGDLTSDEAEQLRRDLNNNLVGTDNAGKIAVINRSLKFTPWSMSAADTQFLQSRTFQIDEIGRWFGVPPHLLGLVEKSTSWGQGISEQNRGLARYTLQPWTARIEARLSPLLPAGKEAEFDYKQFVNPSPEDEIALLINQVNAGLLTPNEARAILNKPPIAGPNNDELRLPAGSLPPDMYDGVPDKKDTE